MPSILKKQINLQQTAPYTYVISWHTDWTFGSTLNGGCIAATIHHAAQTFLATDQALVAKNQPDVLKLHLEYLRPCGRCESTITITPLRIGSVSSTLQLQLSQNGETKVIAFATSTNFDRSLGPSVGTVWRPLPPPKPVPDFDRVSAHQREDNWIPGRVAGELTSLTARMLFLHPRGGFPAEGICDAWNGFLEGERMDETYLAMMTDIIPSMSDTMLRTGGLYDAHTFFQKQERWAQQNPGIPFVVTNTMADAQRAAMYNFTVTLDVEFKRRLPKEGLRWVFTRTAAKMLRDGRMDVDITICNEDMELVCVAQQLILVLEAQRKFRPAAKAASML